MALLSPGESGVVLNGACVTPVFQAPPVTGAVSVMEAVLETTSVTAVAANRPATFRRTIGGRALRASGIRFGGGKAATTMGTPPVSR